MKYKREFKIGLISFIVLIAFIWGVNFIKGHNIFSPNYNYYALYASSGGLQAGRPVKINGVTVGIVSEIKFSSRALDSVTVRFDVNKKYRFTRNSIAEINSGTSLMSDVELNILIYPGDMLAENGDTLAGVENGGLSDMIKNTVVPIKTSMIETLASLDSALRNVNALLNDQNRDNLSSSLASLSVTLDNARTTTAHLNRLLARDGDITQISANLANATGKINTLLDTLSAEGFAQSVDDLRHTIAHLRDIVEKVDSEEGSIGKLLNDPTVYDNLVAATASLDALLVDIKANPRQYVNVTVFGKKERSQTQQVRDSISAARLRGKASGQ